MSSHSGCCKCGKVIETSVMATTDLSKIEWCNGLCWGDPVEPFIMRDVRRADRAEAGWVKEIETNRVLRHQIIALQKDARNRT